MLENLKKLVSYYKPYKKVFMADMFFAIMASFIALLIPLVVRYVTAKVNIYASRTGCKNNDYHSYCCRNFDFVPVLL